MQIGADLQRTGMSTSAYNQPSQNSQPEAAQTRILTTDQQTLPPSTPVIERFCTPSFPENLLQLRRELSDILTQLKTAKLPFDCTYDSFEKKLCRVINQLAKHIPDLIEVTPDSTSNLVPVLTFKAVKKLTTMNFTTEASEQHRLKRTHWIELDENNTDIEPLKTLIDQEMTRKNAFHSNSPGNWIPLVVSTHGHMICCCMRWTGKSMMIVITGSLGFNMCAEKGVTKGKPDEMLFLADDATGGMIFCMSTAITEVSQKHLKQYQQSLLEEVERTRSSRSPQQIASILSRGIFSATSEFGQILFFEPQRQHDSFSCSTFALNDLRCLLSKSVGKELAGKEVDIMIPKDTDQIPPPELRRTTPIPVVRLESYPDIKYYKLVKYPIGLLKPTQSISLIDTEVTRIREKDAESKKELDQMREQLAPFIHEFPDQDEKKTLKNTFAVAQYLENLLKLIPEK